jgi:predicted GNAT family acetyltransferase
MHVEGYALPHAWYRRTVTYLTRFEAENNLLLGLASALMNDPGAYADYYLAAVVNNEQVVAAAVMTVPYNLVLSHIEHPDALDILCGHVSRAYRTLPGVTGRKDVVHEFARLWTARSGQPHELEMAQRIYQLSEVKPPAGVQGELRDTVPDDVPLLAAWQRAFSVEAGLDISPERSLAWAERLFTTNLRRVSFWTVDGEPVSMVGSTGPTPNGIRIGPVYTPPEHRRRGYASACTAAVSQRLLAEGRKFCFLYTDLANPTSNKIYQDIGYTPVCDSDVVRFEQSEHV